jgi:penicillin-insensitive murein endopeptidase
VRRVARRAVAVAFALALTVPLCIAVAWLRVAVQPSSPSRSEGTHAKGALRAGRPLPPWGPGFTTYSFLGAALGRQYLNAQVRDALVASFAARDAEEPDRVFVTGETGWPRGGRLRPHRTHQDGLSADIFMPLDGPDGRPRRMPTWPWNKLGYGLEFDERGRLGDLRIAFEPLARFLLEVDRQASARGLRLERIIVAPEYVPLLLATPSGGRLGPLSDLLTRRPAWVRHDEHFHLDFAVH